MNRSLFILSLLLLVSIGLQAVSRDPNLGSNEPIHPSAFRVPRHPLVEHRRTKAARRLHEGCVEAADSLELPSRGLLILANFADRSFRAENTPAELDSMLNGTNYTYHFSIGSARKYFCDQSNGKYDPHFDVFGPLTLPQDMAYYGRNDTNGDDARLGQMVLDACSLAVAAGADLSLYDHDEDGILDFVYILYAGYGEADGGGLNCVWPASWDMESAIYYGTTELDPEAYTDTELYTIGGKVIGNFAYSNELSHNYRDGEGRPLRNGIGTFCHEFSHVLGLPDLYDTGTTGYNDRYRYNPGNWSLMATGNYNWQGEVPPNYSAYDKWFLGWETPVLLNSREDVTLPADGCTYFYVNSPGVETSPTSAIRQYYLENRQQSGWDVGIPGHGLLVWKVVYDESAWLNNEPNNTEGDPKCAVVSASGQMSGIGTGADPFPGTQNVTSFTPFVSYPLTNITEQNGQIEFRFMDIQSGLDQTPNGMTGGRCYDLMGRQAEENRWGIKLMNGKKYLTGK